MSILRNFFKRMNSDDEETSPQKRVKVSRSEDSLRDNQRLINSYDNGVQSSSALFKENPPSLHSFMPNVKESNFCFSNSSINEQNSSAKDTTNKRNNQHISKTASLESNLEHASQPAAKDEESLHGGMKGKVMMMGEGSCGQLGLGEDMIIAPELRLVRGVDGDVVDVCAGGMHTLLLTQHGKVYSFGCNDQGALGRRTKEDSDWFLPQPVTSLESYHVIRISAGDSHSAAVTEEGLLFVWGTFRKENGDCRFNNSTHISLLPVQLTTPSPATDVQSGSNHLLVLTEDCEVLSMGSGERGQLGRIPESFQDPSDNLLFTLEAVSIVNDQVTNQDQQQVHVVEIWAGNYSSFARDVQGNIYAWGLNNYHQLGFPDTASRYLPCRWRMNPPMAVLQISPGDHHTLLLSEEGDVFSIGKGHYGQLGHGKVGQWNIGHPDSSHEIYQSELTTFTRLESLSHVAHVMAGLSVSFAVLQDGSLYRWGQRSYQLGGKGDADDEADDEADDDDEASGDIFTPELIECDSRVIKVSSNGLHTAVMVA